MNRVVNEYFKGLSTLKTLDQCIVLGPITGRAANMLRPRETVFAIPMMTRVPRRRPAERFEKEFDVVVCFRGLASSPDPEKLLKQCSRVLGPKGWLVLGSETSGSGDSRKTATRSLGEHFTYQLLAGQSPINVFSHVHLTEMLKKAGFRVENEVAAPDWGTPLYLCSHEGYSG